MVTASCQYAFRIEDSAWIGSAIGSAPTTVIDVHKAGDVGITLLDKASHQALGPVSNKP